MARKNLGKSIFQSPVTPQRSGTSIVKTKELQKYLVLSYAYARTLKSKPTKKKLLKIGSSAQTRPPCVQGNGYFRQPLPLCASREPQGLESPVAPILPLGPAGAQESVDKVVHLSYPHECSEELCDVWWRSDS